MVISPRVPMRPGARTIHIEQGTPAHDKGLTAMEPLSLYHRATVAMWQRGYVEVIRRWGRAPLAEAAVHAVLYGLRRQRDSQTLLDRYRRDVPSDYALIDSMAPTAGCVELLRQLRDAAFHLRWLELGGQDLIGV